MWTVLEHRRVGKQADSIPRGNLVRYETWKDIVTLSGLEGLRYIDGFCDEARPGKKKGRRQSRLGAGCRVIYRVKNREIRVRAIRGK